MILNIIGLILNFIGTVMLYFFGLSQNIDSKGTILLALEQTEKKEIVRYKRYKFLSQLGIFLLAIGFLIQLIAEFICR
jgi:hypothetical protein